MKYGNKKVTVDGILFDSKHEASRYTELKLLLRAGEIYGLELQKEFELIPAQFESVTAKEYEKSKGKKYRGKCLERSVKYKADFVYFSHGEMVVEDTKGVRTKDYIIKRKLMLYKYGIRIKEL